VAIVNQADDYEKLLKAIRVLSPEQRAVLDQLCCGNDVGHNPRTVASLIRCGLVEEYIEEHRTAPHCNTYVYWCTVRAAVHMAWAAVRAEENPDAAV